MTKGDIQHHVEKKSEVQLGIQLHDEIDGMWMLMRRTFKRRCNQKLKTNKNVHKIEILVINKESEQQHENMKGPLPQKVGDPQAFRIHDT